MVTLEEARRVIAAAEQKAVEIKQPTNIAVVDEGGNLVSHVRMDGAWIGSIDISIFKAFTSRAFDGNARKIVESSDSQTGGRDSLQVIFCQEKGESRYEETIPD